MINLIFFDSYYPHKLVCLTFTRNPLILIKMKTFAMNLRNNKGPTKSQVPRKAKLKGLKERTTIM